MWNELRSCWNSNTSQITKFQFQGVIWPPCTFPLYKILFAVSVLNRTFDIHSNPTWFFCKIRVVVVSDFIYRLNAEGLCLVTRLHHGGRCPIHAMNARIQRIHMIRHTRTKFWKYSSIFLRCLHACFGAFSTLKVFYCKPVIGADHDRPPQQSGA